MSRETFMQVRQWALVTGVSLSAGFFAMGWLGIRTSDFVPMVIASIAGFEMALLGRDLAEKRLRG
ncbi:hypothetical protein ACOYW6_03710 [Parablastomonas sp. CN1-191]|uniref:hypothetical protein n=1 Tax=Parablastomonas sp. CN1-191 TaxID=3400908 RepID=UPI003BF7D718